MLLLKAENERQSAVLAVKAEYAARIESLQDATVLMSQVVPPPDRQDPSEAQRDPCRQAPGNFRVIRGGSWSWYGYSQRAADREFNSPDYPGHAYYGFRVALSEAGWEKLAAR